MKKYNIQVGDMFIANSKIFYISNTKNDSYFESEIMNVVWFNGHRNKVLKCDIEQYIAAGIWKHYPIRDFE